MSYKSEFSEVYNYLSDCCKDPIFITPYSSADNFLWKDDDPSTGVVIKYKGTAEVVRVPKGVVEIGSRNSHCKYDPDGLSGCFEECSMSDVILPKSLKIIGNFAFCRCKNLTKINVPDGVISIGGDAFCGCANLTSIIIPNSLKKIGFCAFYNCNSLTSIDIPNSVISIGEEAFSGCKSLESINIPNSVEIIGDNVFWDSGLTSITCSKKLVLSKASIPEACEVIRR